MHNLNVFKILSINLLMFPMFSFAMEVPNKDAKTSYMLLSIANHSDQVVDAFVTDHIIIQAQEDKDDLVIHTISSPVIHTKDGVFTLTLNNINNPTSFKLSSDGAIIQQIPYNNVNNIIIIINPGGSVSIAQGSNTAHAIEKINAFQKKANQAPQVSPSVSPVSQAEHQTQSVTQATPIVQAEAQNQAAITKEEAQAQLTKAIRINSLIEVKKAINVGADVNYMDPDDGKTPLWRALLLNESDIVVELIKSGAKTDVTYNGKSFAQGILDMPRLNMLFLTTLITNGINFSNIKNNNNQTVADFAYKTFFINQLLNNPDYKSKLRLSTDIIKLMKQIALHGYKLSDGNKITDSIWNSDLLFTGYLGGKNLIELCLVNEANINKDVKSSRFPRHTKTPLFFAVLADNYEAAEDLLNAGADINLKANPDGKGMQAPLDYAEALGNTQVMRVLIKHGAKTSKDLSAETNQPAVQPEAQAQSKPQVTPVVINTAVQDKLVSAILKGLLDEVKKAIDAGADVNLPDSNGKTPLALAVLLKKTNVVIALIEAGAKVDPKAIQDAANLGDIKIMLAIVKSEANVSPYMQEYMRMCVRSHGAQTNDALELMQELITRGYSINDVWKIHANDGGNVYEALGGKALKLVLEKGANPNQVTPGFRFGGQTPLLMAIFRYSTQAVKTLVEAGADINQKAIAFIDPNTQRMVSPLSYAIIKGKPEIIEYLLGLGAKE